MAEWLYTGIELTDEVELAKNAAIDAFMAAAPGSDIGTYPAYPPQQSRAQLATNGVPLTVPDSVLLRTVTWRAILGAILKHIGPVSPNGSVQISNVLSADGIPQLGLTATTTTGQLVTYCDVDFRNFTPTTLAEGLNTVDGVKFNVNKLISMASIKLIAGLGGGLEFQSPQLGNALPGRLGVPPGHLQDPGPTVIVDKSDLCTTTNDEVIYKEQWHWAMFQHSLRGVTVNGGSFVGMELIQNWYTAVNYFIQYAGITRIDEVYDANVPDRCVSGCNAGYIDNYFVYGVDGIIAPDLASSDIATVVAIRTVGLHSLFYIGASGANRSWPLLENMHLFGSNMNYAQNLDYHYRFQDHYLAINNALKKFWLNPMFTLTNLGGEWASPGCFLRVHRYRFQGMPF